MPRTGFTIDRASTSPDSSKNFLINGNLDFWQRGISFPAVANLAYTADRFWAFTNAVGTVNVTRQDISALNIGSEYAIRVERSLGTDVFRINQSLETVDLNSLRNRDFTFSVLLRKSALLTSDVTLRIATTDLQARNSAIQDSTTVVIPNADLSDMEFRRFSITFTIPGGSTALGIQFDIGANQLGAAGVYFEATQAMVNYGPAASSFNTRGESAEAEFSNCQRFYEVIQRSGNGTFAIAELIDGNTQSSGISFATPKRVQPTAIPIGLIFFGNNGVSVAVGLGSINTSVWGVQFDNVGLPVGTTAPLTVQGTLAVDAEL